MNVRSHPAYEKLSLELWTLVFRAAVDLDIIENQDYKTCDTRRAPMLLLQVCRGWRELALASPELWEHLSIRLPPMSSRFFQVQDLCARSRAMPLSLRIDDRGRMSGATVHRGITDVLFLWAEKAQLFSRLRALSCRMASTTADAARIRALASGEVLFPALESLELELNLGSSPTANENDPHVLEILRFFRRAPQLRRFILRSKDKLSVLPSAELALHWPSIDEVQFRTCIPQHTAYTILSRCRFITHLHVARGLSESLEVPGVNDLALPSLTHLSVMQHQTGLLPFLEMFSFPRLRSLSITANPTREHDTSPDNLAVLSTLQQRDNFTLTAVTIHHLSRQMLGPVTDFLRANPTIERLGLVDLYDQQIINRLAYNAVGASPILPLLQNLQIGVSEPDEDSDIQLSIYHPDFAQRWRELRVPTVPLPTALTEYGLALARMLQTRVDLVGAGRLETVHVDVQSHRWRAGAWPLFKRLWDEGRMTIAGFAEENWQAYMNGLVVV
ncbi:F-box domain-containing protein [Mycena kentingensis (nom. inval.)]|nr:F-box domain-containing protein [Mycena kentingensis (nom. inval.)]